MLDDADLSCTRYNMFSGEEYIPKLFFFQRKIVSGWMNELYHARVYISCIMQKY